MRFCQNGLLVMQNTAIAPAVPSGRTVRSMPYPEDISHRVQTALEASSISAASRRPALPTGQQFKIDEWHSGRSRVGAVGGLVEQHRSANSIGRELNETENSIKHSTAVGDALARGMLWQQFDSKQQQWRKGDHWVGSDVEH